MKLIKACVQLFFIVSTITGFAQEIIPLWEKDKMPNSRGLNVKDSISNERLMEVGIPALRAFFTSNQENKGVAVLIIPGGGYHHLAYNISGDQLAKWFNTMGIHAFVLNHRLPISPDVIDSKFAPIQDAQKAMQLIRSNAGKWGIDPQKIGVMGSSAGGHLSATLGTFSDIYTGDKTISPRPDFMILISPVIDLGEYAHKGSRDNLLGKNAPLTLIEEYSLQNRVTEYTPPTFLCHAFDDAAVPAKNSLLFFDALMEAGISSSLHIFPNGGHAIALRNNPGSTALWPELCENWLKEIELLK